MRNIDFYSFAKVTIDRISPFKNINFFTDKCGNDEDLWMNRTLFLLIVAA